MKKVKMTHKFTKEQTISLYTRGKIRIDDGTIVIPENAFRGCLNLKTIIIPASGKRIDDEAFAHCIDLNKIVFEGQVPLVKSGAFEGCDNISEVEYWFPPNLSKEEKIECNRIVSIIFGAQDKVVGRYYEEEENQIS